MFIFSRNLISVLILVEQPFVISFNNKKIFISKNYLNLCYANLEERYMSLKLMKFFHIAVNCLKYLNINITNNKR